jgi:hypothetical protein
VLNTINQILTVLVLIIVFLLGALFVWWAIHSVKECKKFAEPRPFVDWRKLRGTIIAYSIMIASIGLIVVILNTFALGEAEVRQEWMTGRDLRGTSEVEKNTTIICVGRVISFDEKKNFETAPELRRVFGRSVIRLSRPNAEEGRIVVVEVAKDDPNKELWSSIGVEIRFGVRKAVLPTGKTMDSMKLHPIKVMEYIQ